MISNKKKVSVIIPFYNGVEFLPEAVESALGQTYGNVEVVVVNDGSKEDIQPFLRMYGDRIIYREQPNQGAAVARNLAMQVATGEYFAFLDADDIWLPSKLEKQIQFMEETGAVWSHTGFYYWWPNNGRVKQVDNSLDYDRIYPYTFVSTLIATPAVVVSRQAMREHPEIIFPPEMRKAQDMAYFRQLSLYYPLALVQEPLCKIRMRSDNSNKQAVLRFNLKANAYQQMKNDPSVPVGAKRIHFIYHIYAKIFGKTTSPFKEKIALGFWALPYFIERLYKKYLFHKMKADERFIKRFRLRID